MLPPPSPPCHHLEATLPPPSPPCKLLALQKSSLSPFGQRIDSAVKTAYQFSKQYGVLCELNTTYCYSTDTYDCMTRSSTKDLLSPLENPKRVLRSRRKLFDTPSLVELNSLEFDQLSEIEEHFEEEEAT
ncbi:hypothetical protein Tco_0567253 [Tanacetum coccineum]